MRPAHLPQLDAFFNHMDKQVGKAHNERRGEYADHLRLGSSSAPSFSLILFGLIRSLLFVNSAPAPARATPGAGRKTRECARRNAARAERQAAEDLPSMIMPIGKERPVRSETPAVAKAATPVVAKVACARGG